MRLLSFLDEDTVRIGVRIDPGVVDLSRAAPELPRSLRALIEAGPEAMQRVRETCANPPAAAMLDPAGLHYLPTITDPSKILCLGLNYADHAAEGGHDKPEYPSFFMRGPSSLVGHGQPMIQPAVCDKLDFEAELALVIARTARHVPADQALSLVAGYAPFNDGSVRPYQRRTSQWTIGKNFDHTGGFGPELVTPDELPPGASGLAIRTRLNGEIMQDGNTADMLFDVAATIALVTECMTLVPGDVIITGTPAGVGHARRPQIWMQPGDVCEVEIEGIGLLRNPIAAEQR